MEILTDCDGVLLNWLTAFDEWMHRNGKIKIANGYNVGLNYGLTKEDGKDLCSFFNKSAAIGWLPPFRDSIKYVRKLHEEVGATFSVITSLSTDMHAQKLREINLENTFGKTAISSLHCLPCGADKDEALQKHYNSGKVWIEDKTINANLGAEMGLNTFLMVHPYNENDTVHHNVTKVHSWKEIYEHIT